MTTAAKKKKVWMLADHTEPPEDVRIGRQGPLLHAQNPVTALTESSATLLTKLDRLARSKSLPGIV